MYPVLGHSIAAQLIYLFPAPTAPVPKFPTTATKIHKMVGERKQLITLRESNPWFPFKWFDTDSTLDGSSKQLNQLS